MNKTVPIFSSLAAGAGPPVGLRCPFCRQIGSFACPAGQSTLAWHRQVSNPTGGTKTIHWYAGARICPNIDCTAIVFILAQDSNLLASEPPETLDFDSSSLPEHIAASLSEAIACHATGAYRASALMVRRTLEEICADRVATGNNLKSRLEALGNNTLIPKELIAAADELRILGNDAAHIEAKAYDLIGREEAELAIEMAKEIVKSTYQYGSLVERLKALKRST